MPMRRFTLLALLALLALSLAACGNVAEKLQGSWKSEVVDAASGLPSVAVFTPDSANVDGSMLKVKYNAVGLTVDVFDTVNQNSVFLATKIEKDSVELQGRQFTKKTKFVRISDSEAQELLNKKKN